MLSLSGLVAILLVMYSEARGNFNHQYCVIGAGPSGKSIQCLTHHMQVVGFTGLQMGYFLHTTGKDYLIIEKNYTAGS